MGKMPSNRLVLKAAMVSAAFGSWSWRATAGVRCTRALQTKGWVTWGMCSTAYDSNARLHNKFLLILRFLGGKAVSTPHLCLGQGMYADRKEVTLNRSLCFLKFLSNCNCKQKPVRAGKEATTLKAIV